MGFPVLFLSYGVEFSVIHQYYEELMGCNLHNGATGIHTHSGIDLSLWEWDVNPKARARASLAWKDNNCSI